MNSELLNNKNIDRLAWDALVTSSPQGSIFTQTLILDAQQPAWMGICVWDGDVLQGVMPILPAAKYGLKYALQPMLSRYWGIIFADKRHKNTHAEYSWKKKVAEAAIAAIPPGLARFTYYFHPAFDYGLPFHWKGYGLKTRYTYRLSRPESAEVLQKGYETGIGQGIRKCQRNGFLIEAAASAAPLLRLAELNRKAGYPILAAENEALLDRTMSAALEAGRGFVLTAMDGDNLAAASTCLYDDSCVYFLSNGVHPEYRKSGVTAFLQDAVLKHAFSIAPEFDFLGSMQEGIEFFFRAFGARPVPYLEVSKSSGVVKLLGRG